MARWGSPTSAKKTVRATAQAKLYRAKIHRLQRIAKKKGLPALKQKWPTHG